MCFQGNITIFTRVSDLRECDADTDTLNNAAITVCLAADQMGKRHIINYKKDYKRLDLLFLAAEVVIILTIKLAKAK